MDVKTMTFALVVLCLGLRLAGWLVDLWPSKKTG